MNLITRKHLSRRAVLRGATGSAALALPFLGAMVPAATALAKTAAAGKPRMGFVYFPHGAVADLWTPKTEGRDFEMSPILKPLEKHRAQMTVVSNLGNKNADSPAVHAITSGTWLSCVRPRESHSPHGGVTIDQMAAKVLSADTTFPSIEACTEPGSTGGNGCDRSYGCSYGSTISFRTETQPLPMENDPRKLFYRMFGVGDTAEERNIASSQYGSLLDLVSEEANALKMTLGAEDRAMMGNYLDSVREIELQVKKKETQDLSALKLPDVPPGVLPDFDKQINLLFDILALAYQGDLTRVVSMMCANEGSAQTYGWIGIQEAFHPLSHHQENPEKMARLSKVQAYHSAVFAKFLDKLAAMSDGEHSVLDNSIFLYGSNMANSNQHSHYPLPSAVFGGGRGKLKGNQHIKMPDRTPLANLLLTLLERSDVPADHVGDSTGRITEI
jgi:hypothetical protein